MKIAIINGPNINMLGLREYSIYTDENYVSLLSKIHSYCQSKDINYIHFQSNIEGEIISFIQSLREKVDGIVINPAAYTHYSIGILDALYCINCIKVEVHISDIYNREEYRKISITKDACEKMIYGEGFNSYIKAINYIYNKLQN